MMKNSLISQQLYMRDTAFHTLMQECIDDDGVRMMRFGTSHTILIIGPKAMVS